VLIDIHTYNTSERDEIDDLGLKKEPVIMYGKLCFKDKYLEMFWVSSTVNEQTKKKEITFYVLGKEFICDYSKELAEEMYKIVAS
jgi:hypothetical protein